MANSFPKLHNAMWPGLVGKEEGTDNPPISLDRMLELTAAAEVDGQKYDGIDYFLFLPHTDPDASDDDLKAIADKIAGYGFDVGSLVAPVWPGTVGDSAMGDDEQQQKFLTAVEKACRIAKIFNDHGVRKRGVIRIDSAEFGVEKWRENALFSSRGSLSSPGQARSTRYASWGTSRTSVRDDCRGVAGADNHVVAGRRVDRAIRDLGCDERLDRVL